MTCSWVISTSSFTHFSYCLPICLCEQSGTCSGAEVLQALTSVHDSTAWHTTILSLLQTYDSEASPPSPRLCESSATLYSNAPTVLCGSISGEHWSHVTRSNCSVIVSASTASPWFHPLVIVHTQYKYSKYICCVPPLHVYVPLPQCWMPRYRYVHVE